jgi:hypothetical protein
MIIAAIVWLLLENSLGKEAAHFIAIVLLKCQGVSRVRDTFFHKPSSAHPLLPRPLLPVAHHAASKAIILATLLLYAKLLLLKRK